MRLLRLPRTNPVEQRGQVIGLAVVMAVASIGLGALVLDVGSWLQAHRATQSAADAAALAAAQALPVDTSTASALALSYAGKNGGGVAGADVEFSSSILPNDTVAVTARRSAAGFLSSVFGIGSVDVSATAQARAYNLAAATYAAPFGISKDEPFLSGSGCPCEGVAASFDLDRIGPGGFEILNIDQSRGGIGPGTLADWIANGLSGSMPLGWYSSDPGAKFTSSQVQSAMRSRVGSTLLFPVYDTTQGTGANLQYRVVGWAGFRLTDWQARGNNATISGYLTHVAWEGIVSESGENYFGAVVVKLVG